MLSLEFYAKFLAIICHIRQYIGISITGRTQAQARIYGKYANICRTIGHYQAGIGQQVVFRLYQCANMLHKTGSRAVEAEGLTTQQWAVLGALSREKAEGGMSISDLARYLMVSRQNLAGLLSRMERDGHISVETDTRDRRSRIVRMTKSGQHVWQVSAQPKIRAYYEQILADFSISDTTHALHYLLKLLENMKRLDSKQLNNEDVELME